ncbi:hypothetical protein [Agrobacterium leguminum]|uniref:hypothetical protein n=1 Tax=Agrobacterium leguminum TaxID=2792015 RepID=UPI0022B821BB|nr:hypothetical protein [Agrobacterium leguminum]
MEILKVFFGQRPDGVWAIQSLKPVAINPISGAEPDFYAIENNLFVGDVPFIGTIHSILGQSCWFPRRTEPVRRIISIEN